MDESVFNPRSKLKRTSPFYGPLALILLFLIIILVMSLFFRVSEIEVINASDYTDQEIIVASGIEKGVNLFFVDRFSAASKIFASLPYMDTVSIRRQLPKKIVIQAEGSAPAAYMMLDGEYWFLDRNGRALGVTTVLKAEAYPEIRSLETITVLPGEDMIVEGENTIRLRYIGELLNALTGVGLTIPDTMLGLVREEIEFESLRSAKQSGIIGKGILILSHADREITKAQFLQFL